jgi:hypothetical protein
MNVPPWSWFRDVFVLQNQSEWFFRAGKFLRETKGVGVRGECIVIIAPFFLVRCAAFRMAPDAVLQHGVPDETSPDGTSCGILADSRRIDCSRKSYRLLHLASLSNSGAMACP